jgi:hypothetical protein
MGFPPFLLVDAILLDVSPVARRAYLTGANQAMSRMSAFFTGLQTTFTFAPVFSFRFRSFSSVMSNPST